MFLRDTPAEREKKKYYARARAILQISFFHIIKGIRVSLPVAQAGRFHKCSPPTGTKRRVLGLHNVVMHHAYRHDPMMPGSMGEGRMPNRMHNGTLCKRKEPWTATTGPQARSGRPQAEINI
jgi:hypothetical protein